MFSAMVIVNIATRCVIKLHGKYIFLLIVLLVVGIIKHQGRCSPKGEGFVAALVKNSSKKYKTIVMIHIFQVEWWEKHPSVDVHLVYYS